VSGTTSLVSVNERGISGGNAGSGGPLAFSPDGTALAFFSGADNLGPVDTVNGEDLFLRDLEAETTSMVSVDPEGTDSALVELNGGVAFSPDGTKIAFSGAARNLVATGTNHGHDDVFVRDLVHQTTTLVSVDPAGTSTGNEDSSTPSAGLGLESAREQARAQFSPAGGRLVFVSRATNLSPTDHDPPTGIGYLTEWDVFVATLRGADLSLEGDASPDPVEPGETVTYRFAVANGGPDPAEDARVAVVLPREVTFLDVETTLGECHGPRGREPGQVVVCQLGDMAVDAAGEVTVTASAPVEAPAGTRLTAKGAVGSGSTVDPVHNNDVVVLGPEVAGA
jgi:uncharacterized repeat protein (TIGR01451 family)